VYRLVGFDTPSMPITPAAAPRRRETALIWINNSRLAWILDGRDATKPKDACD
jgi:hypothetical protein